MSAKSIKVLGSGCSNCRKLFANTKKAVAYLGLDVDVVYVTDMKQVMHYGAMRMPVLVVNEKVVAQGKVLRAREVEKLLRHVAQ